MRLQDLLAKAGVKAGAVDVSFGGLDRAPMPTRARRFVKSLAFDHANDGEVIVAYEMNGKPLPMLNGFPLRLIVPGWFATYWVKALKEITRPERAVQRLLDGQGLPGAEEPRDAGVAEGPGEGDGADQHDAGPVAFVRPEPGERVRRPRRRRLRSARASRSMAATESRKSKSPPTAAGLGRRRNSGRTWASTPGAAGGSTGSRRARAAHARWRGRRTTRARRSRVRAGTAAGTRGT